VLNYLKQGHPVIPPQPMKPINPILAPIRAQAGHFPMTNPMGTS
jgi:hypothetical protein